MLFISDLIHCYTFVIDKSTITIYNHIKYVVFICILLPIEKALKKETKMTYERYNYDNKK